MAKAYRNEDIYVALLRLLKNKGSKGVTNEEMYQAAYNHAYLTDKELNEILNERFSKDRSDSANAKKDELDNLFKWAHKRNSVKDDDGTTRYLLSSEGYFQLLQLDELSEAWEDMKFARNDSATARAEAEEVQEERAQTQQMMESILSEAKAARTEANKANQRASTLTFLAVILLLGLLALAALVYLNSSTTGENTSMQVDMTPPTSQVDDSAIQELQEQNNALRTALDEVNTKLADLSKQVEANRKASNAKQTPRETEDYEIIVPLDK